MSKFTEILPTSLRQALRNRVDALFSCDRLPIVKVGKICVWHVIVSSMARRANVLSGGAGNDISFELAMASDHECRVAIFDPSPTGKATFLRNSPPPPNVSFHTVGLAALSTTMDFGEPDDVREGSYKLESKSANTRRVSFPCLSPQAAMRTAGMTDIDLLKIDIEGFEYEFLNAMLDTKIRPTQIAVEFHDFMRGISWLKTFAAIRRLRAAGYRLVHKSRHDYLFVRQELVESLINSSAPAEHIPVYESEQARDA